MPTPSTNTPEHFVVPKCGRAGRGESPVPPADPGYTTPAVWPPRTGPLDWSPEEMRAWIAMHVGCWSLASAIIFRDLVVEHVDRRPKREHHDANNVLKQMRKLLEGKP